MKSIDYNSRNKIEVPIHTEYRLTRRTRACIMIIDDHTISIHLAVFFSNNVLLITSRFIIQ